MLILKYFIIGNGFDHRFLYQLSEIKPDKISRDVMYPTIRCVSVDFIVLIDH